MRSLVFVATLTLTLTASAQWDIQDSGTKASLRGIHSLGKQVAWASGTDGTVLRTEDGGHHWQHCTVPPGAEKLDFRGVQGFDAETALVMSSGKGDLSRMYRTADGCRSWKLMLTNPEKDGFWDAFAVRDFEYIDQSKSPQILGWILGDPVDGHFRIYNFTEAHNGWNHVVRAIKDDDASLRALPFDGAFAASNSALIGVPMSLTQSASGWKDIAWKLERVFVTGGKSGSRIFTPVAREGDSGPTEWKVAPLPLGDENESSGAFSIALAWTRPVGVVVGGDYLKPEEGKRNAAYWSPANNQWTPSATSPHGYRSSVAYDPSTETWITVGTNGTDLSTDDGRNWRALKPGPNDAPDADKNWNALSLPFVVGPHGRIGVLRPSAVAAKP